MHLQNGRIRESMYDGQVRTNEPIKKANGNDWCNCPEGIPEQEVSILENAAERLDREERKRILTRRNSSRRKFGTTRERQCRRYFYRKN